MPIPDRFQLKPASKKLIQEMSELCDQIEDAIEHGGDATELLARWHEHAKRKCEPHEFANYWRSTDKETFIRDALSPKAELVSDLNYAEVRAVLESVVTAKLPESKTRFYLRWLEAQFPKSNMNDLIFWPDVWFGDASLFRDADGAFKPDAELSLDQILAYAMARSGRKLHDAPDNVETPFPLPTEK